MTDQNKRILVMGVGNILYTDEGIGVRAIEELEQAYTFSENVTVMDGGTLGTRLIPSIMDCDILIVVDAVLAGDPPGALYRLTGEDLRKSLAFKDSMHDTDLCDTLVQCEIMGNLPDAVIIGMEPFDYQTMSVELSKPASASLDKMKEHVLKEVEKHGGGYTPRTSNNPSQEKIYVPRSSI
ncbi:MAG: HyaD/HybD family hydrogenase maturation endopeptidase [Desulfovibrio sp.]